MTIKLQYTLHGELKEVADAVHDGLDDFYCLLRPSHAVHALLHLTGLCKDQFLTIPSPPKSDRPHPEPDFVHISGFLLSSNV